MSSAGGARLLGLVTSSEVNEAAQDPVITRTRGRVDFDLFSSFKRVCTRATAVAWLN